MKPASYLFLACLLILRPEPEVKTAGALRKIMQDGNLSAHLSLDTLLTKPFIYGLGLAAGIKGELIVMNSKAYWCKIENGVASTTPATTAKAAMFVYAQVPAWKQVSSAATVSNLEDFEKLIETHAAQYGLDLQKPFPFLVSVAKATTTYHIIDWKDGVDHTYDNHKQFALNEVLTNCEISMLGFYSQKHHGVFTHHSSPVHIHIINDTKTIVGHLDDISLKDQRVYISFPAKD